MFFFKMLKKILITLFLVLNIQHSLASTKIFPGAEGFGTQSPGGRGGKICKVDNLLDSGPGSLRNCLNLAYPRVVVFDVSGTIVAETTLKIEHPFVSIYGQTAPGDGIMLTLSPEHTGPVMQIRTHDVLLHHLRLRAGPSIKPSCCRDALSIASEVSNQVYNVVVDHCSISWGTDEVMEIWYDAHDITVSWSIISEGLNRSTDKTGDSGRGFIAGSEGSHSFSIHHNLFAHNYQRNPLIKSTGVADVVNNVIFHWVSRAAGLEAEYGPLNVNFVKNQFISLNSRSARQSSDKRWGDISVDPDGVGYSIYLEDNHGSRRSFFFKSQTSLIGIGKRRKYSSSLDWIAASRHKSPKITEFGTNDLVEILSKKVGAILPRRDEPDTRIIRDLVQKTGKMPDCVAENDPPSYNICKRNNLNGWPKYEQTRTDRIDSDNDGLPDQWEIENGTNPEDGTDSMSILSNGYSVFENWLFKLPHSSSTN